MKCYLCGSEMQLGVAIYAPKGFCGNIVKTDRTELELMECMKCVSCRHSDTRIEIDTKHENTN
jgi:hypothetical protein